MENFNIKIELPSENYIDSSQYETEFISDDNNTVDVSVDLDNDQKFENSVNQESKSSRSWIWNHFHDQLTTKHNVQFIGKSCNYCQITYDLRKAQGSTKTLSSHLKSKHPEIIVYENTEVQSHLQPQRSRQNKRKNLADQSKSQAVQGASMENSNPLTSHILDTSRGRPAANVLVKLHKLESDGSWNFIAEQVTNNDGRVGNLLTAKEFTPSVYKLHFDTKSYFAVNGEKTFYPYIEVVFEIENPGEHYHVPILLNAYGFSTYRGS